MMKSFIGRKNKKQTINIKNKWSKYALKNWKIQSSYIREYSNRSPKRQTREASGRNSLLESRKKQTEKEVKLVYWKVVHPIIIEWMHDIKKMHNLIKKNLLMGSSWCSL